MGLNFHVGDCGVRIKGFALNVGRTKECQKPEIDGTEFDLAKTQQPQVDGMEMLLWLKPNDLKCMEWTLT